MAIHIKKENVGKFTAYKKRTGKTTSEALHSKNAHVRQMANFARNAKKWKHEDGGMINTAAAMMMTHKGMYSPSLMHRAQMMKTFKREEGGLVQYGFGGTLSSAGAVASAIPTPWTQIGGAALSMIGGIVDAKEQKNAAEAVQKQQGASMATANQQGIYNPYTSTFADGGVIDGPKFGDAKSTSVVTNNLWTPQTRSSIYPLLAQKGLLGHGADSVTMQQWNQFTPQQTTQYMKPDQGFDWTQGHTANPGGVKYWNLDKVPAVNGKSIRASKFGHVYMDEKAKTQYAMGGMVPNMMPNVVVEGGEVLQGKDGSTVEVNGPKHAQGGVPLMMANGGRVFSDKIINPETGNTFAEDANRLRKMMK